MEDRVANSNSIAKRNSVDYYYYSKKFSVSSLLQLCVKAAVGNIDKLIHQVEYLPKSLKARILHLMSKRNDLLSDVTLEKVVTDHTRELDFTNSSVSDIGLLKLPRLEFLYKIDLNDTRTGTRDNVTSAALIHISKQCQNIRVFYCRRCVNVTDTGVKAVAENCRFLEEINLSGCIRITDAAVSVIARNCKNLKNLNLAYTSITDDSAICLAEGLCSTTLQELQMSHCKNLTDDGVEALMSTGKSITYLEIQGCPLLTDRSISVLYETRNRYDFKQFNYTIPI